MKVIKRFTSTNGRWGMTIVGPEDVETCPIEGRVMDLGDVEGHRTFQIIPEEGTGRWYYWGEDIKPHTGCSKVYQTGLQSGHDCALIVGGEFFAVEWTGYRGRSSHISAFHRGELVDLPPEVQRAMGLLGGPEPVEVDVEPEPVNPAMAEALKKAGLA